MKLLLTIIFLSTPVFARQYIQCADVRVESNIRMVLNISGDSGTMYAVDDVTTSHRKKPVDIIKTDESDSMVVFEGRDGSIINKISFSTLFLQAASSYFEVVLEQKVQGQNQESLTQFGCYSSIYEN